MGSGGVAGVPLTTNGEAECGIQQECMHIIPLFILLVYSSEGSLDCIVLHSQHNLETVVILQLSLIDMK